MFGAPERKRICTSHVERLNLTLRMTVRRFTRLTNGHSKSGTRHAAMQGIFFCFYNFCRKHESIKMTLAQASGAGRSAVDSLGTVGANLEMKCPVCDNSVYTQIAGDAALVRCADEHCIYNFRDNLCPTCQKPPERVEVICEKFLLRCENKHYWN